MSSRDSTEREGGALAVERRKPRLISERFQTAVAMIKSLPKEGPYVADNTTKLRFYALYKQATEGPCRIAQPGFWDLVGKAKWEAWHVCGNMSKEIAMELYVEELTEMVKGMVVKGMPKTTEVEEFLSSIGPFYEEEEEREEEPHVDSEGVVCESGESGEGGGGEGEHLSSTVLHRIDELEVSQVSAGEDGERREEGEGSEGEAGEGEGEVGSVTSNEDYQESFQDLQSGEAPAGEDQLSPWHDVSPDSLSPSFEMVPSDPEHKTPNTNSPPENPLPSHTSDFRSSPGGGSAFATRTSGSGARSKVNETHQTSRSNRGGVSPVVTIRHSGDSGEGVIVTGGHDQQHPQMTSSSLEGRGDVGGDSAAVALQNVYSQVTSVRESIQDVLQQLNMLSQSVQGIMQRYYGLGNTPTGRVTVHTAVRAVSQRRGRSIFLLLLGWPLLAHFYFIKKNAASIPLWVWSVLYAVHVILCLLLKCGLPS